MPLRATPRLTVSPVALPSRSRNGWATATRPASAPPRQAKLTNISPGRNLPWSSRRTSPLRSSASSSREVVDLASPVAALRPVNVIGSAECTTSDSRRAARSTAWVPFWLLMRRSLRGVPLYGTQFYYVMLGAGLPCGQVPGPTGEPMFVNTMPRYEILSADAIGVLERGWRRIVSEIGVQFAKREAVELFAGAGQRVDGEVVYLGPEFVLEQVARAPREFDVQARNPARSVHIGGDHMVFSSVYGCPFVREGDVRRDATLDDFRKLAMLSQDCDELDSAGGVICEPNDAPLDSRHLDMIYALATLTDKFYMGNVVSGPNAADTIAMTEILFGGREAIEKTPAVVSLINCNSPLRWDDRMLDAQFAYCAAGQPVVLTPFLLMGAMSPVTIPAALAQQLAEALSGIALAQLIRPGCPVIFGSFLSNIDMQSGSPAFGTPESALGLLCTGQLARHYGLPFRTGGGLAGGRPGQLLREVHRRHRAAEDAPGGVHAAGGHRGVAGVRGAPGGRPRRALPRRRAHHGAVPRLLLPPAAVVGRQLRAVAEARRQGRRGTGGGHLARQAGLVPAPAAGRRDPGRAGRLRGAPPPRTRRLTPR